MTEVLMSLLVMGIGLTTLATLFPISILRTVRATQLTNGTIHRYNAETLIGTYPHLVHDPDNDADFYRVTFNQMNNLANAMEHFDEDLNGDDALQTATEDRNNNQRLDRGVYAVDPYGWYEYQSLNLTYPAPTNGRFENYFGNYGFDSNGSPNAQPDPDQGLIPRFNGINDGSNPPDPNTDWLTTVGGNVPFPTNRTEAAQFVTLPDSWTHVVEAPAQGFITASGQVIGVDMTGTELSGLDVDAQGVPQLTRYRVTLFDTRGRGSLVRQITRVTGNPANVLEWSEDFNGNGQLDGGEPDFNANGRADAFGLPAGFEIERVRLEKQDWRYSWLLTVRKNIEGQANVDVVVFFSRSFNEDEETIHQANFVAPAPNGGFDGQPGQAGIDDDNNGTVDDNTETGTPGTDDNRTAQVDWSATGVRPALKRGGWVFETLRGNWYRIQDFRESGTTATLLLHRDIEVNAASANGAGAMLPKGVVDVFGLPSRETFADQRRAVR